MPAAKPTTKTGLNPYSNGMTIEHKSDISFDGVEKS